MFNRVFGLLVLLFTMGAFAQVNRPFEPYPCRPSNAKPEINLSNSDDLFMAGRFLVRNYRELEGIQCLNLAKDIAPAYLDVRLELLYAFIEIGDKDSALAEAYEFSHFYINQYYAQTHRVYARKILKIHPIVRPRAGFSFMPKMIVDEGNEYKVLAGEKIINEEILKEIVILKHQSFFVKARKLMDEKVLPFNPHSATVYMYSGLIYYNLNMIPQAERDLKIALNIVYNDPDVILSISRALNSQGKFFESYYLLKSKIGYFNDYGCFQLGTSLKNSLVHLNIQESKRLDQILMDSLYYGTTDSTLCRKIETLLK